MKEQERALARPSFIALAALLLLLLTVTLGASLGFFTRAQFSEIKESWTDFAGVAERKGTLISEIRGSLGYGGIIHNFKNYVLRQDASYLAATKSQIDAFNAVITEFETLPVNETEREALASIARTIKEYETRLPIAVLAARQQWPVHVTDRRVRVDDDEALSALNALEEAWRQSQQQSTDRLIVAVDRGQWLINTGFLSIAALMLAALVIGFLLYVLYSDLRQAISDLARELTERQRLERSEERLATIVEQSPTTILMTDVDARIEYVNAKFEELTGWTREEIVDQTPAILQSGETPRDTYREIQERLQAGSSWQGIFRNRKKDGSDYWTDTTILPLIEPDGKIHNYVGIGEDITEKREARDQIARAQKLEAVGQLAGGVAHDFNNILTTIIGASHLAAMDAPKDSDLAGEIDQIEIAAKRAQSLVRELLTFARREPGEIVAVNLAEVIDEVTRLLRPSIPPVINISYAKPDEPVFVLGDRTHLHQIVMNLCRNAAEAMEGNSGNITLVMDEGEAFEGAKNSPHGWVKLEVIDDGPGISAEVRQHLFEPFFTTKPLGKGSGLGLSVVFGLVEEVGGRISVESERGQGATFTVILPRALPTAAKAPAKGQPLPRGTERILLVDDEVAVSGAFRRLLLRLGYQVDAFISPLIALEHFRKNPSRFDLVISDIVMPDMTGEELTTVLRDLRPDIPIIFCSAYKPRAIKLAGPAPVFLDKPVEPMDLAKKVRALLKKDDALTS